MRATTKSALLDYHLRQLHESAISDEVIEARGYQTVSRPTAGDSRSRRMLKLAGISGKVVNDDARYPGLWIPVYRATGEQMGGIYRPENPRKDKGKPRKYEQPVGESPTLDVHPFNVDKIIDPTMPLWITEGIKKGDSLTTAGVCAVSLSGVWNWRKGDGTLGDREDILLKGRLVIVCFDADVIEKRGVCLAMRRLGKWLRSKGAVPKYIVVPAEVDGTETKGADDYLTAGGTIDGLLAVATTSPPDPPGAATSVKFSESMLGKEFAASVLNGAYLWVTGDRGKAIGWFHDIGDLGTGARGRGAWRGP